MNFQDTKRQNHSIPKHIRHLLTIHQEQLILKCFIFHNQSNSKELRENSTFEPQLSNSTLHLLFASV